MLRSLLRPSVRCASTPRISRRFCSSANIDLVARASALNIKLTNTERSYLARVADFDGDGIVSEDEYGRLIRQEVDATAERRVLLEVISRAHDGSLGMRMLLYADFLGTSLFAVVGTHCAGEVGMNVVGCTIVGCAGALGGGTLNHLLVGRGGPVFWMSDPRFLLFAALSSVATFYMWPAAEEWAAQRSVWGVGELTAPTLYNVPLEYVLETIAIGALGVIGAQTGVKAALPAPACVALGVTVCAGGLVRDVLCKRDVALGSQSFALATGAGAVVYVGCRKVAETGLPIPISVRVSLAMTTTVLQRAWAWRHKQQTGEPALAPYAGRRKSETHSVRGDS